jgi:hypothetical protein
MKSRAALLTFGLLAACCPAMAKAHHGHHDHYARHYAARTVHHANLAHRVHGAHHADAAQRTKVSDEHVSHSGITCEMVRAYVAQVGLAQAAAMAQSAGISAEEKDRAKHCLEQKS